MYTHEEILEYIEFLRDCIPNAIEVFTRGNCASFAIILERKFDGGVVLHNMEHACFKYKGLCYDITGNIIEPKNSKPITEYGLWIVRGLLKNNYKLK